MLKKLNCCLLLFAIGFSACAQETTDPVSHLQEIGVETHLWFRTTPIIQEDIHSFLISYQGKRITEHYYNGFTADSLNNVKSVTKSITALLIGIALEEGLIQDLDQKLIDFFPDCEQNDVFNAKGEITLRAALLMQTGIAWNNRARIKDQWWYHESPHCYLLTQFPMDTLPGKHFSYNSAISHLLSGIIARQSGRPTLAYARKKLFDPLGITAIRWDTDAQGDNRGNSELYLRPQDMLPLGQMMLDRGKGNGRQLVPEAWIDETLAQAYDASTLMDDGYHWMASKQEHSPDYYFAGGRRLGRASYLCGPQSRTRSSYDRALGQRTLNARNHGGLPRPSD